MVHFDAFDAFSVDALVHFGSGIQVQGGGELHENIFSILLWDTSNLVILAWKLGCFIVRQPNKYSCFGGPCHPEDLAWMFGVAGQCWMEGAGRGCFPLQYKQVYTCHK